jgi:predicted metal-dependent enzyme (double-stranded beta helix superfamily)
MHIDTSAADAIVAPIARAVGQGDATYLADALIRLHDAGLFGKELFCAPNPARYARRLVHRDAGGAFIIVAMTWSAHQGSGLHDHGGLWGAEIVVDGCMRETTYELHERCADRRYRFALGGERRNSPGAVGVLVPPLEYHDFVNATDAAARTLHVYAGDLRASQRFTQERDGLWTARRVECRYDG